LCGPEVTSGVHMVWENRCKAREHAQSRSGRCGGNGISGKPVKRLHSFERVLPEQGGVQQPTRRYGANLMLEKTGYISKEQKEHILKSVDIVQLIGGYVQLKPAGKNFLGLCPFHSEKTPPFTVSPAYQNYKCYGCGVYGDAIRFIMEIENFDFREALQYLADRCGIELRIQLHQQPESSILSDINSCLRQALGFYRDNLKNAQDRSPIRSYLKLRRVSATAEETFQLGFIGPGWTQLHDLLKTRGIDDLLQEEAGLIKRGEKGGYYDRMRNRLIFPIRDVQGRLLGFAGRAIGDETPKYLNPPESAHYRKSGVLYGAYEARDGIRKKRTAIIVEGYLDVIAMHENGWLETVAACGTALTEEHVKALKRLGAESVFILFDGDRAGVKAAEKSAELFLKNDIDSRVVILPNEMDPDDYFKDNSRMDFQKLLDEARFDYEFVIDQAKINLGGTGIEFQKKAIREMLRLAASIPDSIKRDLFVTRVARDFRIEKKNLFRISQADSKEMAVAGHEEPNPITEVLSFGKNELPEIKFMQYLISYPQSVKLAREHVKPDDFRRKDLSQLYSRILELNDEELLCLKAHEFPEFFIEFNTLITYLLQWQVEYRGPSVSRKRDSGSERDSEMMDLQKAFEAEISSYSEKSVLFLIRRLKKRRKSCDIKGLYHIPSDRARSTVLQLSQKRKRDLPV